MKTPEISSQEEIFDAVKHLIPGRPRLASGGLPDVKGVSDVDVSLFTKSPGSLLHKFPEGTLVDSDDRRTIYSIPGYDREVNVFATSDRELANRAVDHRKIQLMLMKYPKLVEKARKLKAGGLGTESAWAKVLGLEGDPYEAMLDKARVLEAAKGLVKTSATAYHYYPDDGETEQAILSSGKLVPGDQLGKHEEEYEARPPGRDREPGKVYLTPHDIDWPGMKRVEVDIGSLSPDTLVQSPGKKMHSLDKLEELLKRYKGGRAQELFDAQKERRFKKLLQLVHPGEVELEKFQQYADAPSLAEKTANRAIPDCIDVNWSEREAAGSRNPDDVLWDIPQPNIYIQESKQHGKGTHAAKTVQKGSYACVGLVGPRWRTPSCRYINHSPDNNVELEWVGNLGMFKAIKEIRPGEELLLDYRELPWYELTLKSEKEASASAIVPGLFSFGGSALAEAPIRVGQNAAAASVLRDKAPASKRLLEALNYSGDPNRGFIRDVLRKFDPEGKHVSRVSIGPRALYSPRDRQIVATRDQLVPSFMHELGHARKEGVLPRAVQLAGGLGSVAAPLTSSIGTWGIALGRMGRKGALLSSLGALGAYSPLLAEEYRASRGGANMLDKFMKARGVDEGVARDALGETKSLNRRAMLTYLLGGGAMAAAPWGALAGRNLGRRLVMAGRKMASDNTLEALRSAYTTEKDAAFIAPLIGGGAKLLGKGLAAAAPRVRGLGWLGRMMRGGGGRAVGFGSRVQQGSDLGALWALVRGAGGMARRSVGRMTGWTERGVGRQLHSALGRGQNADLYREALSIPGSRQGFWGRAGGSALDATMSPLKGLTGFLTKRGAGGRAAWLARQAQGNTKAWQNIAAQMGPERSGQLRNALLRTNVSLHGRNVRAANALRRSQAGLMDYTTTFEPVWGTAGVLGTGALGAARAGRGAMAFQADSPMYPGGAMLPANTSTPMPYGMPQQGVPFWSQQAMQYGQ